MEVPILKISEGEEEAAGCCCAQVLSEPEMNQRTIHTPGRVEPKQSLSRHNEVPGKATSFFSEDLSTETIYCLFKRG